MSRAKVSFRIVFQERRGVAEHTVSGERCMDRLSILTRVLFCEELGLATFEARTYLSSEAEEDWLPRELVLRENMTFSAATRAAVSFADQQFKRAAAAAMERGWESTS